MNRTRRWLSNKWHAAVRLGHFVHLLANWQTVCMSKIRMSGNKKRPLPSLRFRNGLILNHGTNDDPLVQLDEVFIKRLYDFKTDAPRDAKASGFKWRIIVRPWNEGIIYARRPGLMSTSTAMERF